MARNSGQQEISIRPWVEADIHLLYRLLGDPIVMENLGGPEPNEKIRERNRNYTLEGSNQFVIELVGNRIGVGWTGFWEREWKGSEILEMGWMVLPEYWGLGIATRSTTLLLEIIKSKEKGRSIHAFPSVMNRPSNAICERLGFTLLEDTDFEYPTGHVLRCNNWAMDL